MDDLNHSLQPRTVDVAVNQALNDGTEQLSKVFFEMAKAYANDPAKFDRSARGIIKAAVEVPVPDGCGEQLYLRATFPTDGGIKRSNDPRGLNQDEFTDEILKPALREALSRFNGKTDFDATQIVFSPDGKGNFESRTPIGSVEVYREDAKDNPFALAKNIEKNAQAVLANHSDKKALEQLHKDAEILGKHITDGEFNSEVDERLNYLHVVKDEPETRILGGRTHTFFTRIRDKDGNQIASIVASPGRPTEILADDGR